MDKAEIEDRQQSIKMLGKIRYFFPLVFLLLAFVFYINQQIPALLAWIFFAVGVMEYFLIGLLIDSRRQKLERELNES